MEPTDDATTPTGPGRILTNRSATAGGLALGLVFVVLAVAAMAAASGGSDAPSAPPDDEVHVEVDPLTDRPIVDGCADAPGMCGDDAGAGTGPCDDVAMCGQVTPDAEEQEIDAGSQPCVGELCGDIGPGREDDTGP